MKSLITTKSRTVVRIESKTKKKPMHLEVIKWIKSNYYEDAVVFVNDILNSLNRNTIESILYPYRVFLGNNKCKLIIIYLEEKLNELRSVFEVGLMEVIDDAS